MPRFNRKLVLFWLEQSKEHMDNCVAKLKNGGGDATFEAYALAIYTDLNRAWYARHRSKKAFFAAGDATDQYPTDLDLP